MMWTGACAEMRVCAATLEVRIHCEYRTLRPYLSFEVDGLRAQVFSPLPGTHWHTVFLGMDAAKAHSVRITLETQAFSADPESFVALLDARTDGTLMPLAPRNRRIEFIGDSIASGEGVRGPHSFMEWLPMCFSASDNFTRLTAEKLHADIQVISQSGWGVTCGWNNDPRTNLPAVYDFICRPAAMGVPLCCYALLEGDEQDPAAPLDIQLITLPYDRDQSVADARLTPKVPYIDAYIREVQTGVYSR